MYKSVNKQNKLLLASLILINSYFNLILFFINFSKESQLTNILNKKHYYIIGNISSLHKTFYAL